MHRIHLYGASNLWLSRRAALAGLRARFSGPLEVGLACGPGRSYGVVAGNPLVRYPALNSIEFSESPHLAILTDIGNDIAYGQDPKVLMDWLRALTARIETRDPVRKNLEIVLTGPPIESIRTISPLAFPILRSLLYPWSKVTREQVLQSLEEVARSSQALAQQRGYHYFDPDPKWYGLDRIHLASAHYQDCWENWLQRLAPRTLPLEWPNWWSTLSLCPDRCWVLGREWRGQRLYHDFMKQLSLTVL